MTPLHQLLQDQQAGITVYSPDCTQSRLWGNLDHAIQQATGFQPVYRRWLHHDINSVMRFYSAPGEDVPDQNPAEAAQKYASIPAADLKYGHLVVRLFLAGPVLLTIWRATDRQAVPQVIDALLKLKGATQPAQAEPGTIRGGFWCDNGVCNLIHTSDSPAEAVRELTALGLSSVLDAAPGDPLPLLEPVTLSGSYVPHSGIAVLDDVVRRMLVSGDAGTVRLEPITLPASGDTKITEALFREALRQAADQADGTTIAAVIKAFLAGDLVALTGYFELLPVTPWEKFVLQCGAINRDTWNTTTWTESIQSM